MDQSQHSPNPINIIGNYIEVDLGDGFKALFDLEDIDKITQHKWLPFHNGNTACHFGCRDHIYPCTTKVGGLKAHNLVMDFTPNNGMTVDHINKNTLDNRKSNLRIATKSMQSINQNIQRNSTTGRAGVSLYSAGSGTYASHWYENGKKVRKYFNIKTNGEEVARQKAFDARLAAERRIPVYAEALYNRKLVVERLIEVTGKTEWDGQMPGLLETLMNAGVDVEQFRC